MISFLSSRRPFLGFTRAGRLGLPTALIAFSLLSCVQDQDFLIIERATFYDENCTMSSSSGVTVFPMLVDVKFDSPQGFGIGMIVTNNLSPNDNSNTGIDDSEIVVESALVNLSFSGGAVSPSSFEVPLPSNSIQGSGSEVFLVRAPPEVVTSLRASMNGSDAIETLEMEVVFKGHRMQFGDKKFGEIETRPYVYPFDICFGCLETCLCDDGLTMSCPGTGVDEWAGGGCGLAQATPIIGTGCP